MLKSIIMTTVFATALGTAIIGYCDEGANSMKAPAEPVVVTNFGKKPAVTFDHAKHLGQGIECISCHHNAESGQFKCGECHKAEDGDAPALKQAAHGKEVGACYGCHLDKDAAQKKKCNDCHAK